MNKQRREKNENVGSDGREKESVAARQGGIPCYQPLFPTSSPPWPSSSKAVQITTCLISKSSFNIRPPLSPHPYIALTLSSVLPSFNPSCLKNVDGVDIHRQMVSPSQSPAYPRDRQEYCLVLSFGETPHPWSTWTGRVAVSRRMTKDGCFDEPDRPHPDENLNKNQGKSILVGPCG